MIDFILYPPNGNVHLKQNFNIYSGKSSGVLWKLLAKSVFLSVPEFVCQKHIRFVCVKLLT